MPTVYKNKEENKEKLLAQHTSTVYQKLRAKSDSGAVTAFAICPPGIGFATQEPEEKVILLLRQHPIVNLGWVFIALVLMLMPSFASFLPLDLLPDKYQLMLLVLWYLMVLSFVLERFLGWFFNVYIVTDERVVDIGFYGLIYRDITVTQISKIQDINFKGAGALSAIFDYGDVYVQTAGESREFDFLRVPNPARVVEIMYQLMQEEEQEAIEGRIK